MYPYNWHDGNKVKKLEITEDFKTKNIRFHVDTPVNAEASSLTTDLEGDNNDLVFTAKTKGEAGDNITITYVVPDEDAAEEVITVTGTDIVVTLRKSGAILSTASQVKAAIEADDDANALVTVTNAAGNDGTGNVVAMAKTALDGGVDGTVVPAAGIWFADNNYIYVTIDENTVSDANWRRISLGTAY